MVRGSDSSGLDGRRLPRRGWRTIRPGLSALATKAHRARKSGSAVSTRTPGWADRPLSCCSDAESPQWETFRRTRGDAKALIAGNPSLKPATSVDLCVIPFGATWRPVEGKCRLEALSELPGGVGRDAALAANDLVLALDGDAEMRRQCYLTDVERLQELSAQDDSRVSKDTVLGKHHSASIHE